MSDNQLARTGSGLAVTIAGVGVVTGWWLLLLAALAVVAGAVTIKIAFRRGRSAGQPSTRPAAAGHRSARGGRR